MACTVAVDPPLEDIAPVSCCLRGEACCADDDEVADAAAWSEPGDDAGIEDTDTHTDTQTDADAAVAERDASAPACCQMQRPVYLDGLPVLSLRTHPSLNRDGYTPAQITFLGQSYRNAEAKYRGQTSFTYPKKSFTLKFDKQDPFAHPDAGFVDNRKVVLISSFDDNSYLRQAAAFAVWNRIDPGHLPVRTAFVVLELDGEYHGLYLMADHINRHFMAEHGLWDGGNLYKARTHAADFRSVTPSGASKPAQNGFTKEEGARPTDFGDLIDFVHWLDDADESELAAGLSARIDVRDYEGWFILATLIDARDSAGKNAYHYRDDRPMTPAGVFRFVPWDFNASFGQAWNMQRLGSSQPFSFYLNLNAIFERLYTSQALSPAMLERYRRLLRDELSLEWMQAWIEETRDTIRAAAQRDEARWGAAQRSFSGFYPRESFTDFDEENVYVTEWVAERWPFVLALLDSAL